MNIIEDDVLCVANWTVLDFVRMWRNFCCADGDGNEKMAPVGRNSCVHHIAYVSSGIVRKPKTYF